MVIKAMLEIRMTDGKCSGQKYERPDICTLQDSNPISQ